MTRKEEVELKMRVLGVGRVDAEFIVAIERGEIEGDIVVVDEKGNEIHRPEAFGIFD